MNNNLENLYGNNNVMNNENNNQSQESFNNNISSEQQDLTSLYGSNNNDINQSDNNENRSNITLNQEGLNMLYNQNTVDLEAEPIKEGNGPVIVKPEKDVNQVVRNEYVTEEDFLVAYVGKRFEKIASKPFNFAAFFFGNFYLFYRKKLLYGIIILILTTILSRFLNIFLIGIGIAIITGVSFNTIYIKDAKSYIIRLKKKNLTLSNVELRDKCKKAGGTSFLYLIIGLVLSFFIVTIVSMIMINLGFTNVNTDIKINIEDIINKKNTVYLGEVEKDKTIDITTKYSIEVPKEFNEESKDTSEYKYNSDNCEFSLYKALKVKDSKDLAKEMSIYYLSTEDVKTTTINNINWYYIENKDGTEKQYHYITNNKGEIYIFEYNTESKDKECLNNKDKVLNSIKTK